MFRVALKIKQYFNPRSREGSDAWSGMPGGSCTDFNPRSREGSDSKAGFLPMLVKTFQSALP